MIKKNILITGAGGVGTYSIYKELKNRYNFYFADNDIKNIHSNIPKNKCHQIPLGKDKKNYKNKIFRIIKKLKIDLIIPTVDEELEFYSKYLNFLSLVPDNSFIKIFNNKYLAFQSLKANKIKQPTIFDSKNIKKFNNYPAICKPNYGRGSKGIKIIKNYKEYVKLKDQSTYNGKNYILQKYVSGTEYSIQMIADRDGNLKYIVPVKIILKKGITIEAVTSTDSSIIKFCKNIHSIYKPKYVYNIQLIKNKKNIYCIEINPRISTTHILTLKQKIDPLAIFFNKKNNILKKIKIKKIFLKRIYETYLSEK